MVHPEPVVDDGGVVVVGPPLVPLGQAHPGHVVGQVEMDGDVVLGQVARLVERAGEAVEHVAALGPVEVHPVTEDRLDDWLDFFDHHAMVDVPHNAACYCLEAHERSPGDPLPAPRHWTERRAEMLDRLRAGAAFGYLAYVDGRPAAWVNASRRADTSLFRRGDDVDATTVAVACFAVAPPYRGHGLARRLLDRVVADAGGRGATAVEAYPPVGEVPSGVNFRGGRPMYDAAGFTEVKVRSRDVVVRRAV